MTCSFPEIQVHKLPNWSKRSYQHGVLFMIKLIPQIKSCCIGSLSTANWINFAVGYEDMLWNKLLHIPCVSPLWCCFFLWNKLLHIPCVSSLWCWFFLWNKLLHIPCVSPLWCWFFYCWHIAKLMMSFRYKGNFPSKWYAIIIHQWCLAVCAWSWHQVLKVCIETWQCMMSKMLTGSDRQTCVGK